MDEYTSGVTTYHVNEKSKASQVFTDASKAGEAWYKAALDPTSNVIMKTPEGRAKLYAAAGTELGQVYKDLPFDNMPGAAEFKHAFKESLEREKAELSKASNVVDMPTFGRPERGQEYQGKIVEFRGDSVLQAVTQGSKTVFVEHKRSGLHIRDSSHLVTGKNLSIRYPFSANIGIVNEHLEKNMKTHEYQPKAFGGVGR